MLAVQTAISNPEIKIVARPQSFNIFTSSPSEKNGSTVLTIRTTMASAMHSKKTGWRTASFVVARAMIPAFVV